MSLPPASVAEARELVDRILCTNGCLSKEDLDTMKPPVRRKVEMLLRKKDEKIGASALTYAPTWPEKLANRESQDCN